MRGGRFVVLGALVAVCMAAPGAARAGGVRTYVPDCNHLCETVLQYTALPGERNVVSAQEHALVRPPGYESTAYIVEDSGAPLIPGSGCHVLDEHTAECDVYDDVPLSTAKFDLGDRSDRLTSSLEAVILADGGSGNDQITGGNLSDKLRGGDGNDLLTGGAGRDELSGDFGNDVLDGGPGADVAIFDETKKRIRVDLASSAPQGGPWSRDRLRGIENVYARHARRALLLGDAGPNSLYAGPHSHVFGRDGNDDLGAGPGSLLEGGAGADSLTGAVDQMDSPRRGPPSALHCGRGRDVVYYPRLSDVVNACESVQTDPGFEIFPSVFEHPRRGYAIAVLRYGCYIEENCPLTLVGRLGSVRGRVVGVRRLYLRYDRHGVVEHHYALRLNAGARKLLRRRGRLKVSVSYRLGPFKSGSRYTRPLGFTMIARR